MKILYIGAVEFSRCALIRLIDLGANVVGICTLRDSPFNADHRDLSIVGEANGIPTLYVSDINSQVTLSWIEQRSPDVIFCFGWPFLLKKELLELPPMGIVGFHPTKLPANRGRHPLIWPLVLGLKSSASTFFFMDSYPDRGDILSQMDFSISDDDDAGTLYSKVIELALSQISEFLPLLESGHYIRKTQDDVAANLWRKRNSADGKIDWRMSAHSIHNLIRGLTKPYVGAHFNYRDAEVKVWKSEVIAGTPNNFEPGKVVAYRQAYPIIKCGQDAICLTHTEPMFTPLIGEYL